MNFSGSYNPEADILFHNQLVEEFCQQYNLWGISKVYNIFCRKNIQILLVANKELRFGEQAEPESTASVDIVRQYHQMVAQTTRNWFNPRIENYYESKIQNNYLIFPEHKSQIPYFVSLRIWKDSLFKKVDAFQAEAEKRLSGKLSKNFSTLLKVGPERLTVSIVGQKYIVFVIQGIYSPFQMLYAAKDNNHAVVTHMTNILIDETFQSLFKEENMVLLEKHVKIDIALNEIVVLAMMKELTTEDFIAENRH